MCIRDRSSLFEYELTGKVFTTGGNTFYATEPGVVQAKVTGLGKTAQLDITSTYVATTSIKPAANGTYVCLLYTSAEEQKYSIIRRFRFRAEILSCIWE